VKNISMQKFIFSLVDLSFVVLIDRASPANLGRQGKDVSFYSCTSWGSVKEIKPLRRL
jgi:hypothetical protein